ncbi:MAG: hypothetical protein EZS28_044334 [Streblomastix strix]|uniref:Uncharacterized protein n=1 Tax=Streblomastix strix TaxID=222440 RepID=A0A5J4TQB7_9EUKA|nr:MAG: hypothetical protein EZS28_044334 [Streblomastix strix]
MIYQIFHIPSLHNLLNSNTSFLGQQNTPQQQSGGLFGAQPQQQGGLFGNQANTNTGGGIFGQPPQQGGPIFGQPQQSGSNLFVNQGGGGGIFGRNTTAPTQSLFGTQPNTIGSGLQFGSLFGNQAQQKSKEQLELEKKIQEEQDLYPFGKV